VFVNNAGVGPVTPLDDLRVDDWEATVDTNVKGLLWAVAETLPVFRRQRQGHLVVVASTAAYRTVAGQAVYSASKAAQRTLAEGLRVEAGEHLRVTTVSPGFVDTDFAASAPDEHVRAELLARRDAIAIPPEAIARAVAFAVEQPDDVDINEIVVRPTAQS
jgi:NADP-dependent 3-hydroxy acid dehydrogenase YdfG